MTNGRIVSLSGVSGRAAAGRAEHPVKIDVRGMNFYYGAKRALDGISIRLDANMVTALTERFGGMADCFVCGREGFVEAASNLLMQAGHSAEARVTRVAGVRARFCPSPWPSSRFAALTGRGERG